MLSATKVERAPRRNHACMVPRPLGDGLFEVDSTWGTVQPIELAPGVRTIGEPELLAHLERGLPVIDTRLPHFHRDATIPGARRIPHEQILDCRDELDPSVPTVFFCNGPQCAATPDAVRRLLDADYPARSILYYRGGMHDWMTLGYPTVRGATDQAWRDAEAQAEGDPSSSSRRAVVSGGLRRHEPHRR